MKKLTKAFHFMLTLLLIISLCGTSSLAAKVNVAATKSLSATATSDSVSLKWSKVSKATGYRVYKKVDGKWVKLKTQSSVTYTAKGLTASTNYTFGVKTYRKVNGKEYWSSIKTVKAKTKAMADIKTPTATVTSNSVTLKWSKVPGATGYRVYQYQNKKWVKLKSTTETKYTISSLKKATSYKFRVQAYAKTDSGTVFGDYSKTVTAKTTDPTKTKITSATADTTTVSLKWTKVSGATGYRVSVLENGSWKKVKSTSELSYKVTKLKSNTKYSFMVRAYKKSGNKVTWYTPSDTRTVVTKATDSDLKAYRIEKYRKIFAGDELAVKMTMNDPDYGDSPLEIAKKNGNLSMKASVEGIEARIVYNKKSNKTYMIIDSLNSYLVVTADELEGMDMNEIINGFVINNVGKITVKSTTYDGKSAICESYVDTQTGEKVSYYFVADVLVASERVLSSGEKEIIKFQSISTSVSSSVFDEPPWYYMDLSGIMQ